MNKITLLLPIVVLAFSGCKILCDQQYTHKICDNIGFTCAPVSAYSEKDGCVTFYVDQKEQKMCGSYKIEELSCKEK